MTKQIRMDKFAHLIPEILKETAVPEQISHFT